MKKKILALLLSTALCVTALVGCGSSDNQSNGTKGDIELNGSWPEETIKIGVEVYDTTEESVIAYQEYFSELEKSYNIEFMFSESIASAEDELAFAESCAAAGCKGYIGGYNVSMNTIVDVVTSLEMYYWGCERGLDAQYAENEYYLGGFKSLTSDGNESDKGGDYLLGYAEAEAMVKAGCNHVAFCNGGASMGIPMFVDRQEGFFQGIRDAVAEGSNISFNEKKDVIEGWPGTDDFTAAQSNAISSDYDGIAIAFSGMGVWAQPIGDAGKTNEIKLAGVGNVSDSLQELVESGQVCSLIYECEEVVFGNAVPMIINAVNGHADLVKGEEGYCAVGVCRWIIEDYDTFMKVYDKHNSGDYYITAEDMMQFFPEYNKSASKEDFLKFYKNMSLANAVK